MADLLKRFAAYYRPHRGLSALDFSSAVLGGLLELPDAWKADYRAILAEGARFPGYLPIEIGLRSSRRRARCPGWSNLEIYAVIALMSLAALNERVWLPRPISG